MTRTYTHYFGDELVDKLRAAITELEEDWAARARFVDDDAVMAVWGRLQILRFGTELLAERVPE